MRKHRSIGRRSMIEHIVLLKRRPGVSDAALQEALDGLRALKDRIPGILELTVGENFSHRSGGYTHALHARFVDRAALEAYTPHPAHQAVVALLDATTEPRIVVDYEV